LEEVLREVKCGLGDLVSGISAYISKYSGSNGPVIDRNQSLICRVGLSKPSSRGGLGPGLLDDNDVVPGLVG
jgi:hypothetical protein